MSPIPEGNAPSIGAHKFTTILEARRLVDQQSQRLFADASRSQYLLFEPVSKDQFTTISDGRYDGRDTLPRGTRLTYNENSKTLITKIMASPRHELGHHYLDAEITYKLRRSGIPPSEYFLAGATICTGNHTSKQPDSSYKSKLRGVDGWPTVILDSGLSESLPQLRKDAEWWLASSGRDVHLALLISVRRDDRSIVLEAWEMSRPDPARTRASAQHVPVPIRTQEITVTRDTVAGAPLVLGFAKILERDAVPPEGDVEFSARELRALGDYVWHGEGV
ncbi:hypothetical protein VE03_00895 [Pseudogymnoascus sp. 23342-1-I1]|nr:hypothetical protein VE03_00895 [Pseudogymnoascus sp. 23342-1-I1]